MDQSQTNPPGTANETEYRDGKDKQFNDYDRPYGGETGREGNPAPGKHANYRTTQGERGNKNADQNDYAEQKGYGQNQSYGQEKPEAGTDGPGQLKPNEREIV